LLNHALEQTHWSGSILTAENWRENVRPLLEHIWDDLLEIVSGKALEGLFITSG